MRCRMTRNITITCVLVAVCAGAGAAWLPFAAVAQEQPATTEKEQAPAEESSSAAAAQDETERLDDDERPLSRQPRGASVDEEIDAGLPELRRLSEPLSGRAGREFSPEQIERVMQVVRDLDADRAARLEKLRQSDPQLFAKVLTRGGRHLLGLSILKDRDAMLYDLKLSELRIGQQVNRIAQEIHAARETCSEEELERLENMLRERIREQSDVNFRARAREIVLLEDHLKSTREKLVHDITHRDDMVEERLHDLLRSSGEHAHDESESFAVEDQPAPQP